MIASNTAVSNQRTCGMMTTHCTTAPNSARLVITRALPRRTLPPIYKISRFLSLLDGAVKLAGGARGPRGGRGGTDGGAAHAD